MSTEPRTVAAVENEAPEPADRSSGSSASGTPSSGSPASGTPAGAARSSGSGERIRFHTGGPPPVEPDASPAPLPGAGVLAILAVAWLGATLWVLQREISTSITDAVAVASAAISLPTVVSAGLVAGTAAGLVAGNLAARRPGWPTAARWVAALGAAIVVGVLGAVAVVAGYGGTASGVLAGTVAAAVIVGGAVAGMPRPVPVAAVVAGSLTVFAALFLFNFFQDPLLSLGARGWLALASTVVSGLAAGLVPYVYLRRAARRSGVDAPRWPVVMLAGGGVGLLLLVTELITRVGGARILDAVSELSAADRAFRSGADASRLRFALLVLFIGALTATIAFGRTLKRPERPSD
jgi:hypothetical protein